MRGQAPVNHERKKGRDSLAVSSFDSTLGVRTRPRSVFMTLGAARSSRISRTPVRVETSG